MKLFQLVYTSQATVKVTPEVVQNIMGNCDIKNNILRISGILFYQNGIFMQLLEGEETVVRKLFDLISHDTRHTGIKVLYEGHCSMSRLSLWAMGFSSKEIETESFKSNPFYLSPEEAMAVCKELPDEIGRHFIAFMSAQGISSNK